MSRGTHGGLQGRVCSMTNSFVTNAVSLLIERAVSCLHLHQLFSQTVNRPIWIVGCQIYSEIVGSRGGARAPVPHSWRRHCLSNGYQFWQHKAIVAISWCTEVAAFEAKVKEEKCCRRQSSKKTSLVHTTAYHIVSYCIVLYRYRIAECIIPSDGVQTTQHDDQRDDADTHSDQHADHHDAHDTWRIQPALRAPAVIGHVTIAESWFFAVLIFSCE